MLVTLANQNVRAPLKNRDNGVRSMDDLFSYSFCWFYNPDLTQLTLLIIRSTTRM